MNRHRHAIWGLLAIAVAGIAPAALGVPLGYQYVGSRVVSGGQVVLWYWNVDYVDIGAYGVSFVARMHARAVDRKEERPYVAEVRCDSRTYRALGTLSPYETIDPGEPIEAVWRAGCNEGRAVSAAVRHARLNAAPTTAAARGDAEAMPRAPDRTSIATATGPDRMAAAVRPTPLPELPAPTAATAPASSAASDERRVDRCVKFVEGKPSPLGEATITNTCGFAIEVALCYKRGSGGPYDCPAPPKGKRIDSLEPGITHTLPEYRRARHKGIAVVACRGAMGSVFPRLDGTGGGCF